MHCEITKENYREKGVAACDSFLFCGFGPVCTSPFKTILQATLWGQRIPNGKLKAGPAWDYNLAFGQAQYWNKYYEAPHDFTYIGPNQKSYSQMVHWYYRLLQDPVFTRKLTKRYRELRQTVWRDQDIVSKIRSYTKLLSNSQHRNFQVWPINHVSTNHKYIPIKYWGNTWNENVSGLQRWVLQRLEWMDEWVPRL